MAPMPRAASRSVSRHVLEPVLETPPSTPSPKPSAREDAGLAASSVSERTGRVGHSWPKRRDGSVSQLSVLSANRSPKTKGLPGEISEECELSSDNDDLDSLDSFATACSVASVASAASTVHKQIGRLSTPCKSVMNNGAFSRRCSKPGSSQTSDSEELSGAESILSMAKPHNWAEEAVSNARTQLPRGKGQPHPQNGASPERENHTRLAGASNTSNCDSPLASPRGSRSEPLPPRAASAPPRQSESLRGQTPGSQGSASSRGSHSRLTSERERLSLTRVASAKRGVRHSLCFKENLRPSPDASFSCGSSSLGPRTLSSSSTSSRQLGAANRLADLAPRPERGCGGLLPCNRASSSSSARHMATARGQAAKDAFCCALLQGEHRPRCAKLGLMGAARAGKTSTLRALAGLPLRPDEESTAGLAVWELSQELLAAGPHPQRRWQLQEARAAADGARWDNSVAQFVADRVRPGEDRNGASCSGNLGPHAYQRMPFDLIARRLGEPPCKPEEQEESVVLETYDFGGQEVYYAMHHLFLTDCGIYLACVDLSTLRADQGTVPRCDLMEDTCASSAANSWEALEWWLASVSLNAPNSPVAIVGTHNDCLDPTERPSVHRAVHERIVALCARAPELNTQLKVNEADQLCFFPIDNSGADGGASVVSLRTAVSSMATELLSGPLGQALPLRWAHFWAVLRRTTQENGKLCKTEELWHRCRHYGFEGQNELLKFLQHFRRLGALLYFPEAPAEELRSLVCLDPAWVADAAACILVAKDRVVQGCMKYSAELRERGLLHSELLAALWRPQKFARHQQQLLGMLQVFDLLVPWGHDRQAPSSYQNAEVQQVFLIPSLLPVRPLRPLGESRTETSEDDAIVVYLDFHGLLHRLLPTLFPRVLCTLTRMEVAAQILAVYSNYALFAISTQGQAEGDSARSLGGRRQVQKKLLVSLQPCAGGELIRCCLRPRRNTCGETGVPTRPSWRHVERLLHAFKDAVAAWMPRLSFKAGIRCPLCCAGRAHAVDLHTILQDEVVLCGRSGELLEDLPAWLAEWRCHLQAHSPPPATRSRSQVHDAPEAALGSVTGSPGLHLEYLYASPLDASPLDVRAEMEILGSLPGVCSLKVRTATTETLAEVWNAHSRACRSPSSQRPSNSEGVQVLCLTAHCGVDPQKPKVPAALLLENAVGWSQSLGVEDLVELLGSQQDPSQELFPFDVVVLNACHSEQIAGCFITAGARCVVACAGSVFDAAARAFLRSFLSALAAEGLGRVAEACASAKRTIRLSPQPGLRAEAERFKFFDATDPGPKAAVAPAPPPPPPQPPPPQALPCCQQRAQHLRNSCPLPAPVEDFVGRAPALMTIAQAFLGVRRIVWLHGPGGMGKSALAAEFCRFFGLVGDRLFSPLPTAARTGTGAGQDCGSLGAGGAKIVRFTGLSPNEALARVDEALGSMQEMSISDAAREWRWLLVLDGIDSMVVDTPGMEASAASGSFWQRLEDALTTSEHLRLLLTSRKPRYDAPLSYKVVAQELPGLGPEDAALLFARRAHRPLYPVDFDQTGVEGPGGTANGDPLVLAGRKREFLHQLAGHPLLTSVGGIPADILAAAAEVTPQLPTLFAHSLFKARDRSQRSPEFCSGLTCVGSHG